MSRRKRIQDDELLKRAKRLFLDHGLRMPTRTLANELGISEGILFQRFGSKEGLIRAALTIPEFDAVQLVESETKKGNNPQKILENIAVAIFNAFRELLPLYVPLLAHHESDRRRALISRASPFHVFVDALERHLKEARHNGHIQTESPYMAAYFIVLALHQAAFFEVITDQSTEISEGTARDLIRVVWSGLEPKDKNQES